ncbi:MAG TPA: substrate-binding domain-containing protein [Malonomonas sp.]
MQIRTLLFTLRGLCFYALLLLLSTPFSATAETISINGTGDSQRLLRQLAAAFEQQHQDTQVLVPDSVGSGGGIQLLLAGRTDLARVARPLKPKEQAEGLQHRVFAYSPIVFVANLPSPCLQGISAAEAIGIFQGKIKTWGQLGNCPDHKIYIANREDGDSSRGVLEEKIPELKEISQLAGRIIYSTPETYDTLNHYQYSFGYLPKSQIQKGSLMILDFAGIAASVENVQQGRYPLAVPLGIAWKGELHRTAKQFVDFLASNEAKQIMLEMSAIPALNR